jgi:pimeloyl-ACP methyl ester carboxylesterase
MANYLLIHGAGSDSWYWHLVTPRLEALGHDVVAVDLPCDDDSAGLDDYANVVVEAAGDRGALIVVAQSLGGFTAPLVCDHLPVALMVLVAAMVPRPGESAGEWWTNTGHQFPDPFDPRARFWLRGDFSTHLFAGRARAALPANRRLVAPQRPHRRGLRVRERRVSVSAGAP